MSEVTREQEAAGRRRQFNENAYADDDEREEYVQSDQFDDDAYRLADAYLATLAVPSEPPAGGAACGHCHGSGEDDDCTRCPVCGGSGKDEPDPSQPAPRPAPAAEPLSEPMKAKMTLEDKLNEWLQLPEGMWLHVAAAEIVSLRQQLAAAQTALVGERLHALKGSSDSIADLNHWRDRALKAVGQLAAAVAEIADLKADAAERSKLMEAVRADARKALRDALGQERWNQFWGPELEALGSVVHEAWVQRAQALAERDAARADAERMAQACRLAEEELRYDEKYGLAPSCIGDGTIEKRQVSTALRAVTGALSHHTESPLSASPAPAAVPVVPADVRTHAELVSMHGETDSNGDTIDAYPSPEHFREAAKTLARYIVAERR